MLDNSTVLTNSFSTTSLTKICSRCKVEKFVYAFAPRKNYRFKVSCRCRDCDRLVNRETHYRHIEKYRAQKRKYASEHKVEREAYNKIWRDKNPAKVKAIFQRAYTKNPDRFANARLMHEYGISLDKYNELFQIQKGLCAICDSSCKSGKRLSVDHNHDTGEVRGLLCRICNTAIGFFGDDIKKLRKAIAYIEKYE